MATGATAPSSGPLTTPAQAAEDVYEVKRIEFLGKKDRPILLQSKNGPCPLLAIANQLLLSNRLALPAHQEMVSLNNLVHLIAEKLCVS